MTNSYSLLSKFRTWEGFRKFAEWDHDKMDGAYESIHCPANPGHQHGGKRLKNLNVVLPDGEVEDFVWTWQSNCLVRESTLERLRSNGLTGFEVKPVHARFETSMKQPPKLWELVLTGWAGMAKPESGIQFDKSQSCAVCGHLRYTGLQKPEELIDESKWDGSDFFMVWPMPKRVFVTDRVVKVIRDHHLTGVHISSVSDLKNTEGFTPGRLNYYMPDERARRLGEPLGID